MPKISTIDVKHELTDEEINEIAHKLATEFRHFGVVTEEKKAAMSSFKADLDAINKDIQDMTTKVILGYFFEPTECYVETDELRNKRIYRSVATLQIVNEEDIISDQPGIFAGAELDDNGTLHINVPEDNNE